MTASMLTVLLSVIPHAQAIWPFTDHSCEQKVRPSPCRPSYEVQDALNDRLHAILEEDKELDRLGEVERRWFSDATLDQGSLSSRDFWGKINKEVVARRKERDRQLQALLADISGAYNLPVRVGSPRKVVGGAFVGTEARFEPEISSEKKHVSRRKTASGETLVYLADYSKADAGSASTLPNGQVVVRLDAFRQALGNNIPPGGIGQLASVLHHEMIHFEDVVGGGVYSLETSEKKAYREIVTYQDSVYGLRMEYQDHNKDQLKYFTEQVKKNDKDVKEWDARRRRGEPVGPKPGSLSPFEPSRQQWLAMGRRAEDFETPQLEMDHARRRLHERLEKEQRDRPAYERRLAEEERRRWERWGAGSQGSGQGSGCPAPIPGLLTPILPCVPTLPTAQPSHGVVPPPGVAVLPAQPAAPVVLPAPAQAAFIPLEAFNRLAAKGCTDPWAFSQPELDWHWQRLFGLPFDVTAGPKLGLEGCQYSLFMRLMQMASEKNPEKLTREVFAQAATAARAPAYSQPFEEPDEPRTGSRPAAPAVPTCRYHAWCRKWGE